MRDSLLHGLFGACILEISTCWRRGEPCYSKNVALSLHNWLLWYFVQNYNICEALKKKKKKLQAKIRDGKVWTWINLSRYFYDLFVHIYFYFALLKVHTLVEALIEEDATINKCTRYFIIIFL